MTWDQRRPAGCCPPESCFTCKYGDCRWDGSKTRAESLFTEPKETVTARKKRLAAVKKKKKKAYVPETATGDVRGAVYLPDAVFTDLMEIHAASFGWY